jgi:MFS superfamily sulfate permease-like transporter
MIAGLFQLFLGLIRAGGIANYFPSSVIKGMLAAIGILLMVKQIPLALGYDQPDFWTSGFLQLFSSSHIKSNLQNLQSHIRTGTVIISLVSLLILIGWQQPAFKKWRRLPAPLVVVLAGMGLQLVFRQWLPAWALDERQLVHIPDRIFEAVQFPAYTRLFESAEIWKNGLLIGLLASLETLLCVEAVDKLDRHNRSTPVNRELIAQGIGNLTCGALGALPMTAVVVRGAANADAGARTRMASFTHGVFLLLTVLLIPGLLSLIPYASLATILLMTGYNLAKPKLFRHLFSLGWKQFLPFLITIGFILATDLLIGVSIGLLISVYFIVQNNFRLEFQVLHRRQHETDHYEIKLHLNVTFLNKVQLREALEKIPDYSVLTIDGKNSRFIDYDILEIISEFADKAHERHIEVHLEGIERVNVTAVH